MAKDYEVLNELTSKTQELHRSIFDKGYKQGFWDGKEEAANCDCRDNMEGAYNQGLNTAWECAKKIVCYTQYGGLGHYHLNEIFGIDSYSKIFLDNSASEAIAKIKAWEEAQQNKGKNKVTCNTCQYEGIPLFQYPCSSCGYVNWEPKQHKEIKVGDKVRTTQDRDYNGNVLFPIGTIGVIKKIDKSTRVPYQVETKDSIWEWWYSEDMLEVIK